MRDEMDQARLFKSEPTAVDSQRLAATQVTGEASVQITKRELQEWHDDLVHARDFDQVELVIDAISAKL